MHVRDKLSKCFKDLVLTTPPRRPPARIRRSSFWGVFMSRDLLDVHSQTLGRVADLLVRSKWFILLNFFLFLDR